MQESFYRALEDRFRGSRELIKSRLQVYLPFIEPLKDVYGKAGLKAVDLGCGRGEWLEILKEKGFDGLGVDLNEAMLESCRGLGLNAVRADVLDYLAAQEGESTVLITGIHIAEHLPFENLLKLAGESLRILKPGGLLILESPNPENIALGTTNFYIDPTHQRPLSPLLLSFIVEYAGFFRFKIMRLQERQGILDGEEPSLLDVLSGVSPDFAAVAQKKADKNISSRFDELFDKDYGVDLNKIGSKYDGIVQSKFNDLKNWQEISIRFVNELDIARYEFGLKEQSLRDKIDGLWRELKDKDDEIKRVTDYWENTADNLRRELRDKDDEIKRVTDYWENTADNLRRELHGVCTSNSWRATAPLRFAVRAARKIFKIFKRSIKLFLIYSIKTVNNTGILKQAKDKVLGKFPGLRKRLRNAAVSKGLLNANINAGEKTRNAGAGGSWPAPSGLPEDLSEREKKIYRELENEIKRRED